MPSRAALKAVPVFYTNDQIVSAATGRWGDIAAEVKPADPYEITRPDGEPIVVAPLTRRRRKKLKAAQAAYLMTGAQLVAVQQDGTADQGTIDKIQSLLDQADETYNEALFGDAYQDVIDFYEDLQEEFWDAMYQDIHDALVNRVTPPEDTCSKCGQKVEKDSEDEGPGKDESSSMSSTDTSTS